MSKPASDPVKWWRTLFLLLETVVLGTFVFYEVTARFWESQPRPEAGVLSVVVAVFYVLAFLFLLIVSPFFLKSLRWVALAGWIIAIGVFFFVHQSPWIIFDCLGPRD